jgi:transcriptional regulator with XRE-family HTH domain
MNISYPFYYPKYPFYDDLQLITINYLYSTLFKRYPTIMGEVIYNRIVVVLAENRISQKDLATILRVTPHTVSRWCTNKNQPSYPELFKLAEAFHINAGCLLQPSTWPENEKSPVEKFKAEKEAKKRQAKTKSKKHPTRKKSGRL